MNHSLATPNEPPTAAQAALATVDACLGAVHRLAWEGPDERGDRRRALEWFRGAVATLGRSNRALAAVLDWWIVAALGEDPVELAWSVDREIPGRLGEVLRQILESDGPRRLDIVRRPAAFQEVLRELEQASERNPGKIAADKHILGEAISECRQVLRAAEVGVRPPTGLRLLSSSDDDLAAWASEGSGTRRVTPGTPVWDVLLRQLDQRRDMIRRALSLWPGREADAPELPAGWRSVLDASCGDGAGLAKALVEDAAPDPGARPRLEPSTLLEDLRDEPTDDARRRWFVLAREAAGAGGGEWPGWARRLASTLDTLSARVEQHESTYEGDAAEALAVARQAIADIDPGEAEVWIGQAAEMHRETTAGADRRRVRTQAEERREVLGQIGVTVPEDQGDLDAWAEAVEARWREARQSLDDDIEALERRLGLVGRDASALRDEVARAKGALQRGELVPARGALDAARDKLEPLLAQKGERLGARLWSVFEAAETLDDDLRRAVDESIERAVGAAEGDCSQRRGGQQPAGQPAPWARAAGGRQPFAIRPPTE